jgi:adenosylmethionine-8-amino-7-oxononanoate aminotransferase
LLLAIELVADKGSLARFPAEVDPGAVVLRHGLDHGLLLYSRRQNSGRFGDWLLIAPPLLIDSQCADDLLGRLEATLVSAAGELLSSDA